MDRPAVLFQISNHENFFHYLNDGFMGVLQTLTETKLLPDRLARRACFQPHSGAKACRVAQLVHRSALVKAAGVFITQAVTAAMKCMISTEHTHCLQGVPT